MTIEEINSAPTGSIFISTAPIYNEVRSYQLYEDENQCFPVGSRFIKKYSYSRAHTPGFCCKLIIDNKEIGTLNGSSYIMGAQYYAHLALESSIDSAVLDDFNIVY